jgi:hypothetical protein
MVKHFGENNVVKVPDVELKTPLTLRLVKLNENTTHILLLEGEETIKNWNKISVKEDNEILDSSGEPRDEG